MQLQQRPSGLGASSSGKALGSRPQTIGACPKVQSRRGCCCLLLCSRVTNSWRSLRWKVSKNSLSLSLSLSHTHTHTHTATLEMEGKLRFETVGLVSMMICAEFEVLERRLRSSLRGRQGTDEAANTTTTTTAAAMRISSSSSQDKIALSKKKSPSVNAVDDDGDGDDDDDESKQKTDGNADLHHLQEHHEIVEFDDDNNWCDEFLSKVLLVVLFRLLSSSSSSPWDLQTVFEEGIGDFCSSRRTWKHSTWGWWRSFADTWWTWEYNDCQ